MKNQNDGAHGGGGMAETKKAVQARPLKNKFSFMT